MKNIKIKMWKDTQSISEYCVYRGGLFVLNGFSFYSYCRTFFRIFIRTFMCIASYPPIRILIRPCRNVYILCIRFVVYIFCRRSRTVGMVRNSRASHSAPPNKTERKCQRKNESIVYCLGGTKDRVSESRI